MVDHPLMNCGNPQNSMQAFMCNVINNATQVYTNAQLIAYDDPPGATQYQADAVIQCAANMLLMNLGYNMQYAYSPVYLWETQNPALQAILQNRLSDDLGSWNFGQISLQSMMQALVADPKYAPLSGSEAANWAGIANTLFNAVYYIDGDGEQSGDYLAMPGLYNVDSVNFQSIPSLPAINYNGYYPGLNAVPFGPGVQNDQYLGTVLYGLAAANVFQCFGDLQIP